LGQANQGQAYTFEQEDRPPDRAASQVIRGVHYHVTFSLEGPIC